MKRSALSAAGLGIACLLAQGPPPKPVESPKPEDAGGVFKVERYPQDPPPTPPKPEEPKPAVLENTGKPMKLPVACGDTEIAHFGMTCSEQAPCAVYLELANVQSLGTKIFLTGNLHNGASTMYSVLLASEDSGKTWREPVERVSNAGLEHVDFFDFESGWVSGQVLLALPRDPFFFLTTDGGKSWRKRGVFSESRVASIDHFQFESKTAGNLIIDRMQGAETPRYEHHESMTGGESWTVKEVSVKPIRLKTRKAPNPDWRMTADAAAKAHRVEKRAGTKWETVAAFAIQTGECKPAPSVLAEPPPAAPVAPPASAVRPPAPVRRPSAPPTLKKQ